MKKIIISLLCVVSSFAFAADYKLTKSEFLDKVTKGSIVLQKSPIIANTQPELLQKLFESARRKYPSFKDEMFYAGYIDSTDYRYIMMYEWYDRGCIFGISETTKFRKIKDNQEAGKFAAAENKSYEVIDNKYCESLLGITIPSSKGLIALPDEVVKGIKTNAVPRKP